MRPYTTFDDNNLIIKVPFSVQMSTLEIFKTPLHKEVSELNLSHLPRQVNVEHLSKPRREHTSPLPKKTRHK